MFRIRLCNPCNIAGFFSITDANITLSTNATLGTTANQLVNMGSSTTSLNATTTGVVNVFLKSDSEFVGCSPMSLS